MQKITIAAQMFSFRNYIKTPAGVRDTFRRLKRMGYDAIQLSGSIAPMPTADLTTPAAGVPASVTPRCSG